jgi:hypothetical protein
MKQVGAGRDQQCIGPRHRLLHEHIVTQPLRAFDPLTERVAPRRLTRVLDQRVKRVPRDTQRHGRAFRGKHERKCVERSWPFHQGWILKAEALLARDELVVHGNVVAAGTAQPGRIPGVEDFASFETQQALPRFGNARTTHSRRTLLDDVAAEPQPFAMMTSANEREPPANAVAPRYDLRDSGRGRGGPHCGKQIGKHGASDILIEKGTDVTGVAADHRAGIVTAMDRAWQPSGLTWRHDPSVL